MKIKGLVAIFILTAIFAVGKGNHKPALVSQTFALKKPDGIYKFSGKLNDKIPVFLWIVVKDDVVWGEVTYLKTAKRIPIPIVGQLDKNNNLEMFEFAKGGTITGIYRCPFDIKLLKGNWHSPSRNNEFKYSLSPKDTVVNADFDMKPVLVDGTYEYHYGKDGSDGGIDIKKIIGGDYFVEINCVTSPPANNVAEVERTKLTMKNNELIYISEDKQCEFRIKIFKGFAVIDRVKGDGGCGFGASAGIEGVFFKTNDKPSFAF